MSKIVSTNVLLWLLLSALSALVASTDEGLLQLDPKPLHGNKYVVRARKKFVVACTYRRHDMVDHHNQLVWTSSDGTVIDGEESVSLFTVSLRERSTNFWKESLVFSDIQPRDAGKYYCISNVHGERMEQEIEIVVIDKMKWNEKVDVAGAMLGEPLTIDCGASGDPKPDVTITNERGEPLDESRFIVANGMVTVDKLTKDYQGEKIKCLAVQTFTELDTTSIEEHEKVIDVWYAPEFEAKEIEAYGILNRPATLFCNVSESNPPAHHFHFFKNGNELNDEKKFQMKVDIAAQNAKLKIFEVDEDDFGTYKCEVNNGKAKTFVDVLLKEANPPDEVRVSLVANNRHGVVWEILGDKDDELPVLYYTIQHMRHEVYVNYQENSDENSEDSVWQQHGTSMTVPSNPKNLYEIGGLRENTKYVFRFAGVNAAGSGSALTVTVDTGVEAVFQDNNKYSPLTSISVLLAAVVALLLSH